MLPRWCKEVLEGKIVAKTKKVAMDTKTATDLKRDYTTSGQRADDGVGQRLTHHLAVVLDG